MIVPVLASVPGYTDEVLCYALLDTQSDSCFATHDILKKLKTAHHPVTLNIATMSNSRRKIVCNRHDNIRVKGLQGTTWVNLPQVYERDHIPVNIDHIPTTATASRHPHLCHLDGKLSPLLDAPIGFLIGYNCPEAIAPVSSVVGAGALPYGVETVLGWSIVGQASDAPDTDSIGVSHRVMAEECLTLPNVHTIHITQKSTISETPYTPPNCDSILKVLQQDFEVNEQLQGPPRSLEDTRFLKRMEADATYNEQGYCTLPLPFRERPRGVNGFHGAQNRTRSLLKQLSKNSQDKEAYEAFMAEIVKNGEAEQIPKELKPPADCWYLPHFGVRHPVKKKLRVVFDCAARTPKGSLNDTLLQGPDLINGLNGILLRFRKNPVAVTCDIKSMFHRFRVPEEDRDYLRFLWPGPQGELTTYRMCVHLFGATSSPACATYGLRHVAKRYALADDADAVAFISKNFYVDDGLMSLATESQAITLFNNSQKLCARANIRLHKVNSNSKIVMQAIAPEDRAANICSLDLSAEELPIDRTLGVRWDMGSDEFFFSPSDRQQPATRRGLLSAVMSIFDPLGLVAPCVLEGKAVLQEMCRRKADWDSPLEGDLIERWEEWLREVANLQSLRLPRCYFPFPLAQAHTIELHSFADASEKGYGQCCYLRTISPSGVVGCALVAAKARVTPLKPITIPRLELQAAVLSVKVAINVVRELDLPPNVLSVHYWTDSMVVLGYIGNDAKRFHTFVANRVQFIRNETEAAQWRHVPTTDNPADLTSRGASVSGINRQLWFKGPRFLHENVISYPVVPKQRTSELPEARVNTIVHAVHVQHEGILSLLERQSSWTSMVSTVRLLQAAATRVKGNPALSLRAANTKAKAFICSLLQADFKAELLHGGRLPKHSPLAGLDAYIADDGLVRVGGRLDNSSCLSEALRHPIIIPGKRQASKTLVEYYHMISAHQGRSATLATLRLQGFWLTAGRSLVGKVVHQCVACRRIRRPLETQKMADLPQDRTVPQPPFTHAACDVFGPFILKERRSELKYYGLMVTCLGSRAVHIEALENMTTDSFINAYRRVEALRGAILTMRCDNGTNFIGAAGEFRKSVLKGLPGSACEFKFNPPNASHFGGVWERQIRSARNILSGLLANNSARLSPYSLQTLFYEVSRIMNSRPLDSSGLADAKDVPLTPQMLLTGKCDPMLAPPGDFRPQEAYGTRRWRQVQALSEQFWRKWRVTYAASLQKRGKWQNAKPNLQVGAIVLVADDSSARGDWRLGRVVSVKRSRDGLVRSAEVQLGISKVDGSKATMLERPIHKLVELMAPRSDSSPPV